MKYISIVLIAVLLSLFSCKNNEKNDNPETNPEDEYVDIPDEKAEVAELEKKPDTLPIKEVKTTPKIEEKKIVAETKPELVTGSKAEKGYYLIVGSFQEYQNAKKLHKSLTGSEILIPFKKYNRVAKAFYKDRGTAVQARNKYRTSHKNVAAWILYQ